MVDCDRGWGVDDFWKSRDGVRNVRHIYWGYNNSMNIEFDDSKRDKTLLERGLDFALAQAVFEGVHFTAQDVRVDYEED